MAAQIKDLRELTQKVKGINLRGDARERVQAAGKVLANTEPRTMAALTRFAIALGESKKLREVIKDELYSMGRETHGTGYDEFKASAVTLEDVDYLDKTGLESILDYLAAAAVVADSVVEARQDADIEVKKLKETVGKLEIDNQPMKKDLRHAKLNLKDINKVDDKYDPYDRRGNRDRDDDRRGSRDRDYDRDDRGRGSRDRDYDRDDRGRDRDGRRDERGRVKADDRDIAEATANRRGNRDGRRDDDRRGSRDRDYDRDDRGRGSRDRDYDRDGRTPRERDRRDIYDSRRDDDGYSERTGKNYASDLLAGFHKVIYGTSR